MDPGLRNGLLFFFGLCCVMFAIALVQERIRRLRQAPIDSGATERVREKMLRMSRPTLLMVPSETPGFSKIGGLPELPSEIAWPSGEAPAFVAQLEITAFRAYGDFDWLPETGRLYLFFDESLNGAAECGKVIYSIDPPGPPVAPPTQVPKNRRFAERRVGFMRSKSLPSLDWLDEDWAASGVDWERLEGIGDDFGDEIEHRVGGYPSEIQGGQMALECEYLHRGRTRDYREPVPDDIRHASHQWRLLLQIDSDDALNMNWWDGGRLYVFVRARDAKRGDFSKTVTITQTH